MKGPVLLQRAGLDEALQALNPALTADPRYPAALVNRAVVAYRQGRFGSAVADLTATLDLTGDDPDVLLNRGIAYRADGRLALAVADFDHALSLPDADLAGLHYQRCHCRIEAGDRKLAAEDIEVCQQLGRDVTDVEKLLAHSVI